ncbi:hypothetical protein CONLIGDRAFT_642090 [Coniochaeta ligniaria NRRL 30616]|uniref:Uncharacterized protein n=1 Tax=Coniochaeta ligniaria NRRL 30616 TaxID=1408157 RepID=A0A1J7IXZ5_9PEZI|nr:hypothetical protein CONLIGDRAFT_642090 [Coniochaeta ligniaria NRRL 30616]
MYTSYKMLAHIIPFLALLSTALSSPFPHHSRRTIAGVSVLDTPLVRAAQDYARAHSSDAVYKHIMRSWLYGTLLLTHNDTLSATVDLEIHAIAILLHDLGFDQAPNATHISHNRRFEVDGAIAARQFIRRHNVGRRWDERRVQLVWDAIALHSDPKISQYKEPEVEVVGLGINLDFTGPSFGILDAEYAAVVKEFPSDDLDSAFVDGFTWLCSTKPETTYDTFMQPFGERFVQGYNATGHRAIDEMVAQ